MNKKVYTVSVINRYVAGLIEDDMMLRHVSVMGEVSNLTYHSSGHIYFTLKDKDAAISVVMFRRYRSGLKFPMEAGDQIVASGSIGVYEKGGTYQLYAERIEKAGAGELAARVEALKNELLEMGMFDQAYKKPIPKYAQKIGVVTAPTGAVIHDIIQVSGRRNPHVQILLAPAQVQGEAAADSIVSALERLDEQGCDVIICGRGGGSLEDLMAFNTEEVARAIFACKTPVISAVGHETDTTIADLVADRRAATPSEAAELAVFSYDDFCFHMDKMQQRLADAVERRRSDAKTRLLMLQRRLLRASPQERAGEASRKLRDYEYRMGDAIHSKRHDASMTLISLKDALPRALNIKLDATVHRMTQIYPRLDAAMAKKLFDTKHELAMKAQRLELSSPLKKIADGFAYVSSDKGRITSVTQVKKGDEMQVRLKDGIIDTKVEDIYG